ncbi:MAG: chromosome segregation protein SMC, partial [Gammaproteobacteria bacterium]
ARVEQAIKHNKESRQQQQQELSRAEQTLAEIETHINIDSARLQELAHDLEAVEPELATATERTEQSVAALKDAEQAMHAWQQEWDEFNRQSAEHAQAAQVERTRLDHLDRHMLQLDERLQRMDNEQQTLGEQSLEEELQQSAQACETQETGLTGIQATLDNAVRRIADVRAGLEQREQELSALQSIHHDTRGQLASLETLQHAALGQRSEQVSGWLKSSGLQGAQRLAQEIQAEPGWEHAVETALGFYLEAVCVDGLDSAAQLLGSLEQGALALFDTSVVADAAPFTDKGVPLAGKVTASWSMGTLLDGIYAAESLSDALSMRAGLACHESIITRDGVWIGKSWLRVARDSDEKAGVLERERDISKLSTQTRAQAANIEELRQLIATAREELVAAEARREQLQSDYNQAQRAVSDLRARQSALQSRLEQQQHRREHVMMESEVLRLEKAGEAEQQAGAQSRLQEALDAVAALSVEREERTRQQQHLSSELDASRESARSDQQIMHELAIRVESMRTALGATNQSLARMREQCQQLTTRRDELTTVLGQGDTPIVELESELGEMLSRRQTVETELGEARKQVETIEHNTREHDQERIRKERNVGNMREQVEQDRMAWQEIKVRSDTLLEQITASGFEYMPLLEVMDEAASVAVWAERAEKLELRIQRLGPINL